jgi:cytoskeletal protein RodZ
MNDVEKRGLFEQQQKIFEAGAQRADKRTGSFSFLTWSFFIAPLIACEEFLAAMFKSAAAVEEDAKTAQAGATLQAANDDPPANDVSKTSAEDETAKAPAAHPADTGNVASDILPSAAPVDTIEPELASAGVSHSKPATDLLQPAVPDNSTDQAPGPADTLLALATATDAPIEFPGSATVAPASVVTDVSNAAAAVHPTAIAGDVIALNDAPLPPANALFTGTHYTDYGVTLSSDSAVPPQHAVSPADAASAQDTLVPVVADVQQHAPPPPDAVDTTHPIDHHAIPIDHHAIL